MDPMDAMVLVSLVKPSGSRWTLEAAIVTRLAQLRGGGWCWAAQASEWTGADEVKCRRALRSLEARKVIRRDGGDSGRDHIRWCAVNDDWRRWRVEWLIDPSQIAAQLALAAQQREESPFTRIFARSYSARSVARIARSFDARSWVSDLELVAGIARQGNARSEAVENPDRAMRIARSLGRRRAVLERAILGVGSQQLPSGDALDGDKPRADDAGTPSQHQRLSDLHGGWVKAKILRRSIAPPGRRVAFLNGPPLAQLADLIEEHGLDAIAAAVDLVPADELTALFYVEALADLVADLTGGGATTLAAELTVRGHLEVRTDPELAAAIAEDFAAAGDAIPGLIEELGAWQDGRTGDHQEVEA